MSDRLSHLEALEKAATRSPWFHDGQGSAHVYAAEQPGWFQDVAQTETDDDAAFIAATREALPDLLAVARAAREYVNADAQYQRRIDTAALREAFARLEAREQGDG